MRLPSWEVRRSSGGNLGPVHVCDVPRVPSQNCISRICAWCSSRTANPSYWSANAQPARGISPDGYDVPSQACSTCTPLKSVDDLLLLEGRSAANVGRNEYDYEVYALDLYMSNLKLCHDSHIIGLDRQAITPTENFWWRTAIETFGQSVVTFPGGGSTTSSFLVTVQKWKNGGSIRVR